MSVRRSSKTFTTRSVFGSSGLGSSGGLVMNGLGSSGASLSFSGQNYGSAGGFSGRISRSLSTSSLTTAGYEVTLHANEKQTMQNLNDRLASYLERVRSLEQANKKLEMQIKEFYDNKTPMQSKDMSAYFKTILELRTQINSRFMENAKLQVLQTQVTTSYSEIKTSQTELTDLKRTFQSLEIELQGALTMVHSCSFMRNEIRMARYKLAIVRKNSELQKESRNINLKLVKVIVEELVDGKVVSSSVEEQVQEIS
uniref:Keratin, type I cytoskeletal 19-like n=1 Tax=Sinocyclocheilus rhinocerous TaxID=307959 RepID=A0A673JBR3_9TELE